MQKMSKIITPLLKGFATAFRSWSICFLVASTPAFSWSAPLRVAIVGLAHGHVGGFLHGGALVPAGGILNRSDVQIVAVVERDRTLFNRYAEQDHFSTDLYFPDVNAMLAKVHPDAALVFTSTYEHTAVVEACARRGVHVLMEKPLAVSYADALRMQRAAESGKVHVVVDYETTWYGSNAVAGHLLQEGKLGALRKLVVHDGHPGPKAIHVGEEFFQWLTDPKLNGAGALYDFGCYGADLATWLTGGAVPESVTAVTAQLQPSVYPKVDDEADIIAKYKDSIAIFQASWDWTFDRKDMELYGQTGTVTTLKRDGVAVRLAGAKAPQTEKAEFPAPPYDDPIHYLSALLAGKISEDGDLSSLKTNVIVSEILDAARRSAHTGRTIPLPLHD